MAEVKWIKIVTDIFDDEKILLIESMPEHDAIIVIWFKLLCMAGKTNNSGVFTLNDKIAYTDEMLATIFRRPKTTVQLALKTFEQFGMIEIVDGVITIPNWGKHQSLDAYERKKERDRENKRRKRAEQKALAQKSDDVVARQSPDTSTDGAKSRSLEEEGEEDKKEIRGRVEENTELPPPPLQTNYETLCRQYGKSFVDERVTRAKKYSGTTMATVAKWCEEDAAAGRTKKTKFSNFPNRDYDVSDLERKLLMSGQG